MKKLFNLAVILLLALTACQKESLEPASEELSVSASTAKLKGTAAMPFKSNAIYPVDYYAWNPCTNEYIHFTGAGHFKVMGVINGNKITYTVHYNAANIKGVGLYTGTQYINTEAFNYSNNDNFNNTSIVFQQRQNLKYTTPGSNTYNMTIEDDWHLTVNANGEVAYFFTTEGKVVSCQ